MSCGSGVGTANAAEEMSSKVAIKESMMSTGLSLRLDVSGMQA